jgi:hypothetical protein
MNSWFDFLFQTWQQATLMDYANLVIAVVLLGWFIARYTE